MAGPQRRQNFRMGQVDAVDVARSEIGIQRESGTVVELHWPITECAKPQFGALQIHQNADRAAIRAFDIADRGHELTHLVVRRMAHIDSKQVCSRLKQPADNGAIGRRGA